MNILNLFKTKKYPAIVEEIHNEFNSASDKTVLISKSILEDKKSLDNEKAERLKKIGFINAPQVIDHENKKNKIESAEKELTLVEYYRFNYPNNKFITNSQIKTICQKYGLLCGDISRYKGFVPDEKLKQIERFKFKNKEKDTFFCSGVTYFSFGNREVDFSIIDGEIFRDGHLFFIRKKNSNDLTYKNRAFQSDDGINFYAGDNYDIFGLASLGDVRFSINNFSFKICAPFSDMDTTGMRILDGHKLVNIPDPVVLKMVNGGALIVAMWGDETFDPFKESDLINETNN